MQSLVIDYFYVTTCPHGKPASLRSSQQLQISTDWLSTLEHNTKAPSTTKHRNEYPAIDTHDNQLPSNTYTQRGRGGVLRNHGYD